MTKLAIEIDEFGHSDRNFDDVNKRQKAIENELDCKFIRIDTDKHNFNISKAVKEIHKHIKKSSKRSLIDKISNGLPELKFKSNYSIKSTAFKYVFRKIPQSL